MAFYYAIRFIDDKRMDQQAAGLASTVDALIEIGLSVDARSVRSDATTALHLAMGLGSLHPQSDATDLIEVIHTMIKKTKDMSILDRSGRTAFHIAAVNDHWVKSGDNSQTTSIITMLLDKGWNINARDHVGRTPLHKVLQDCRRYSPSSDPCAPPIYKFLVSNGADIDVKDRYGLSPLAYTINEEWEAAHRPKNSDFLSIAIDLLERGANANMTDRQGQTPFHWISCLTVSVRFEIPLHMLYSSRPPTEQASEMRWSMHPHEAP